MIDLNNDALGEKTYGTIFIIENRSFWNGIVADKETDLILCLDFGLKNELENAGYCVEFFDHLVHRSVLDPLNYKTHHFLNNWFKDKQGEDILRYQGIDTGDAHLLLILNEVNYFCHFLFNAIALLHLTYKKLIVVAQNRHLIDSLALLKIQSQEIEINREAPVQSSYLFPILEWLTEKIERKSVVRELKNKLANLFDYTFRILDPLINRGKQFVYVHRYYPTIEVAKELKKVKDIQLVYNNYSGLNNVFSERRIHYGTNKNSTATAAALLENFRLKKIYNWDYDGYDVSKYLYRIIEKILAERLPSTVNAVNSINKWFKRYKIDLMVPVTTLWIENRLIMKYCQANNVPIFMIINGLLALPFYEDGRDCDYVNCYSESIREQYFYNSPSAVPLGDSRMDKYANLEKKSINYDSPVIVIGTAGYNPIDLNSYLAFEFDFLYDILLNFKMQVEDGRKIKIILKIRGNGYEHLYRSFVDEYFAGLDIRLIQNGSFTEVVQEADLYISTYSQTLFEASCMGIPVIYYKKDTQILNKPFDGDCELVTPVNREELSNAITDFFNHDERFESFKQKEVMEKYIGYLDGRNTKRNADFIVSLVS